MNKTGKKRPLKECFGENSFSNELRHKRRRFDNIVLLRDGTVNQNNNGESRYYEDGESSNNIAPRRILRAGGKRKKPTEFNNESMTVPKQTPEQVSDENDIINELTKEFKKARLRPVFFTISSFIEQTVDEVGFTMADEPETEVTICLALPKKEQPVEVEEKFTVSVCPEEEETGTEVDLNKNELIQTKDANFICDFDNFAQKNQVLKSSIEMKKTSSMQLRFSSSCGMVESAREGVLV